MMRYALFLSIYLCLLSALPLAAQQEPSFTSKSEQYIWFRYNLELPLNDQWTFEHEIEERLHASPWKQGEFRLRSHLIRKLGKGWSADLGNMFVWESEPIEPRRLETEPRLEIRPHQQISYQHKLGAKFNMQHSYKIEQRFFRNKNSEGYYRDAGMSFGQMRYRYELEISYQLNEWLALQAFDEVVFYTGPGIGPNPFDRNEMGGGLSFRLSDSFSLDAIYNYRFNPEGIGLKVVHQHVGRFTLTHKLMRGSGSSE